MRCPTLAELPAPPPGKTGWPWTEEPASFAATQLSGEAWPKISIVTPSFNQSGYLEQTIRSILLQGYPDLEYIIFDGGSTDGSVELLEKYSPWLGYWVSERDNGSSDAMAKGLNRANGALLGMMCADDFYAQNALATLMRLHTAHPDDAVWAGSCHEVDLQDRFIREMPPHIHSVETFGNWGGDAWFSTVACLFDAKAYHAVGGMDPNIFITNDFDLMFKLLKYGSISTTMEWITTVHCNPQSLARKMDAVTHAAIVAVNYRHENYDMAAKVMVRFADMRLKYMPIEEVLKIRPAEDFILIIKPRVLLKGLAIRILQIVKRRLRGH